MKKLIYILWALFVFFPFLSYADISISPLRFEFEIEAWDDVNETIRVTNRADESVTLYTSKENFVSWDETWRPRFIDRSELPNPEFAMSNWIEIPQDTLTLSPWETREVDFSINVPDNAEPGWHYWALFFSPGAWDWQVAVVSRIWALMLVDVPWEVEEYWELESFEIWTIFDDDFSVNDQFDSFPISFLTRFENMWNVHIRPEWKIEIINEDWEVLENIWKERITSPAWAFVWERLVDYIPINDWWGNVLPNSIRAFESTWNWFGYNVLDDEWRQLVKFRDLQEHYENKASEDAQYLNFWEKIDQVPVEEEFTIQMELSYTTKDWEKEVFYDDDTIQIEYLDSKTVINYPIIIAIALIFLAIIALLFWNKKRAEEKLRQKIMEEMKSSW